MNQIPMTMIAVLLSATPPPPIEATTDPGSAPQSPTVVLEGERYRDPTRPDRPPSTANVTAEAPQVPPIIAVCPVDAEVGTYGCRTYQPEDAEAQDDERELTEGDIVRAVREIGLPRLDVTVEPGDSTLVNAATNFYTDPEAFARSIDLLGFDVDLQASPITYTWIHGDGSRADTTQPGQPYPDLDVTHRYREPATVVRPHVDVTYRVRYRVDGGAWTTLGQTLTATGPSTDLAVNEAAPVLTAP